jgi:hypothetical protein
MNQNHHRRWVIFLAVFAVATLLLLLRVIFFHGREPSILKSIMGSKNLYQSGSRSSKRGSFDSESSLAAQEPGWDHLRSGGLKNRLKTEHLKTDTFRLHPDLQ